MVTTSLHRAGRTCRIAFLIFTGVALLSACSDSNNSDELFPVGPPLACSDQPIGQPSKECEGGQYTITTPQDYKNAVRKFEAPAENCISPDLYVTAGAFVPESNLYADTFQYAWGNGSTNAHRYLEMNKKWGQSNDPATMIKLITAIQSFIGFGITIPSVYPTAVDAPPRAQSPSPVRVAVYTLPSGDVARVPSFESWFKALERDFQIVIPLKLGQLMIEPYTTMSKDQDVVDVFTTMTGCGGSGTYPERTWPSTGSGTDGTISSCSSEVMMAFDFVVPTTAGPAQACKVGASGCSATTEDCFKGFNENYLIPALANNTDYRQMIGPLRAALAFCQDANPFNTGLGLGYNTAANPFACTSYAKQSVSDRYTGREFIVPNELLSKLDAPQVVDFPPLNSSAACEGAGGTWYVETGRPAGSPQCYFTVETRSVYDFLTEGYGFWD